MALKDELKLNRLKKLTEHESPELTLALTALVEWSEGFKGFKSSLTQLETLHQAANEKQKKDSDSLMQKTQGLTASVKLMSESNEKLIKQVEVAVGNAKKEIKSAITDDITSTINESIKPAVTGLQKELRTSTKAVRDVASIANSRVGFREGMFWIGLASIYVVAILWGYTLLFERITPLIERHGAVAFWVGVPIILLIIPAALWFITNIKPR